MNELAVSCEAILEPIKETIDAWLQRVKSPIIGYVILSYVFFNWKAIWFLVFSDSAVLIKFTYFDYKTNWWTLFWAPLMVGVLSAIFVPWVGLAGAKIARLPVRLLRELQQDARTEHEIYRLLNRAKIENARAWEEAERERRQLDQAKRLKEAGEIGPEARDALEESRIATDAPAEVDIGDLSETDIFLLESLGKSQTPVSLHTLPSDRFRFAQYGQIRPGGNEQRMRVDLEASSEVLKKKQLAKSINSKWSLTKAGYSLFDKMPKLH